ncbi:MAG: hypothetical protein H7330_09110, partial [Hymenobacteraceae bacterium]|nr:hypothetical protein [Hymenobacteraceae bacterium]
LLQRLARRLLTNPQIAVLVTAIFLAAWTEHVLWFNYTRIPVLLAAGAFMAYAFDTKENSVRHTRAAVLFTLAYLLALCIFPTAAVLGLGLALPAAIRVPTRSGLDFKNLATSLVPFVLMSVLFFSATVLTRSEEEVGFHRLLNRVNDYKNNGQYYFNPVRDANTPASERTYAVKEAVRTGLLGDRLAVNESFFARSGGPDWAEFLRVRLPKKLGELLGRLALDYYLVLLFNVVLIVYCYRKLLSKTRRRLLVGTQGWIIGWLLLIGGLWKLPPRLAGPAMVVLTMVNLVFYLRHRRLGLPKVPGWAWGALLILFAVHVYDTGGRTLTLSNKQAANEQFIASMERRFHGQLLVAVGFEPHFSSLSPWQNYDFGQNKVLMLTGWQTMAPEFREYLASITGQTNFGAAVEALMSRPKTIWIAPIGFEQRLNRLLGTVHNSHATLLPFTPYVPGPTDDELNEYLVGVPAGRRQPLGPLPGTLLVSKTATVSDTLPPPAR